MTVRRKQVVADRCLQTRDSLPSRVERGHTRISYIIYEKDQQISLGNPPSVPSKDRQISIDKIDEWILTGVKKVFEPKSKTKN